MRTGLLIDGPDIAAWQLEAARALEATGAQIVLVCREREPPAPAAWPDPLAPLAWWAFDRFDHWLADRRERLRHVDTPNPIAASLPGARERVLPAGARASAGFAAEAFADIELLIDLDTGCGPVDASVLPAGCLHWTLNLSGYALAPGVPRGLWEAARGDETIEMSVNDVADGRVLRRRVVGADRLSWTLQRRMISLLAGPMLADALTDARGGVHGGLSRHARSPAIDSRPRLGRPGTLALVTALARALRYVGSEMLMRRRGLREQWFVMLGRRHGGRYVLRDFELLEPPPEHIWADPFPIEETAPDGSTRLSVLVEQMHVDAPRGHIALLRRDANGDWRAQPVIEEPYHMSYPYLFEWDRQRYLVPETGRGNEISLYRMDGGPEHWVREAPLMRDVRAVDTSLVVHEGRVWMFTSIGRDDDFGPHYRELHLFHSTRFPTDAWVAHPCNPVVCDARNARMGGGFLLRDGQLFRVAQGARAGVYGASIELRRITRLDPQGYAEESASSVRPEWAPMLNGTHHLAELGEHLLIDARRLHRSR